MNDPIYIMREAVTRLTQLLAGKGIQVRQQGVSAFVQTDATGRPILVNLPFIPDNATDELIDAIKGFLDHEVAHILFTDFSVMAEAMKGGVASMLNVIEDSRIERAMQKRFQGSAENLARTGRFFLDKFTVPHYEAALGNGDLTTVQGILMVPLIRSMAGQWVFQEFMRDKMHLMDPVYDRIKDLAPAIANAKSTRDCLAIAETIQRRLREPEPPSSDAHNPASGASTPSGSATGAAGSESGGEGDNGRGDRLSAGAKPSSSDEEGESAVPAASGGSGDGLDANAATPKSKPDGGHTENEGGNEGREPPTQEGAVSQNFDDTAGDTDNGEDTAGDGDNGDDASNAGPDSSEPPTREDSVSQNGEGAGGDGDGGDAGPDAEGGEPRPGEDSASQDFDDAVGDGDDAGDDADGNAASDDRENRDADGDLGGDTEDGIASHDDDHDVAEPEKHDGESDRVGSRDAGRPPVGAEIELAPAAPLWDAIDKETARAYDDAVSSLISQAAMDAVAHADYLVFTKDRDVIEPLRVGRMYEPVMLTQLEEQVTHMVGPLQKDLERAISARSLSAYSSGHRSGRLHAANLARLALGDTRVFRRKHEVNGKDVAVELVVDMSGSMAGVKLATATQAAYALASVLERIGIANEVICFTTAECAAPDLVTVKQEEARIGHRYSRVEALYMPILKGFQERMTVEVKRRFGWLPNVHDLRENVDGECIEIAARRLLARRESGKVMMVLSDGAPACYGTSGALVGHLKKVVNDISRAGISVIGIGIMSSEVTRFYPNSLVLNSINDLPMVVMKQLRGLIVK